jgi:cytidylate kinase
MIITIDGPAASGKSTLAREIAQKLNLFYIASGSIYRATAYILMQDFGYTLQTIANAKLEDIKKALDPAHFSYSYDAKQGFKIMFNDHDITPELHKDPMGSAASIMSSNNIEIHKVLLKFQRQLADDHDVIIDGRDCGSVIFPQAQFKFYVTASLEVRALRWQKLQEHLGEHIPTDQAIEKVKERDARDKSRAIDPLIIPQGAVIIDNSHMNKAQTLNYVMAIIEKQKSAGK